MDVPFRSSGALSRAHYALVRKIESASTVESADQDIFLEINSLNAQLSHPKLSLVCFLLFVPRFLALNETFW